MSPSETQIPLAFRNLQSPNYKFYTKDGVSRAHQTNNYVFTFFYKPIVLNR